jgi:hypothetical protein
MESKKAEGMSINVIIIAILALIVLLVVVLVFSGKMNQIIPSLSQETCQKTAGAKCIKEDDATCAGMKAYGMGCPDVKGELDEYCCYPKPENK